jgi:NAD(P)-dependent dehydrogenase (short-subunit alcohol dehydrogenase family)
VGALVTGAGRGLGARIAALLAERGHVVHVTDLDPEAAAAVAARIGGGAFASALDVRDAGACDAAAAETVARTGSLDVWVNNAGVLLTGPAWEQTPDQRRLMVEVNTLGVINGTVSAIGAMRGPEDDGSGHIVNVASLAGLVAVPGEGVYSGSKHAVLGFSLSTAADLRVAGIRGIDISCVCPDGIWTPMLHDRLDDPEAALSFSGTLLSADRVAAAVGQVLDRPRPVTAVPRWRGAQVRVVDAFPRLGRHGLAVGVWLGRRTQRRLRRRGLAPTSW